MSLIALLVCMVHLAEPFLHEYKKSQNDQPRNEKKQIPVNFMQVTSVLPSILYLVEHHGDSQFNMTS